MTIHLGRVFIETAVVYTGILRGIYVFYRNEKAQGPGLASHSIGYLVCAALLILLHQVCNIYRGNVFTGRSKTIKLLGLRWTSDMTHLREMCSVYGHVVSVEYPYRKSGHEEGVQSVAYIKFRDRDAARRAAEDMKNVIKLKREFAMETEDGSGVSVSQVKEEDPRTARRRLFSDAGLWSCLLLPTIAVLCQQKDILDQSSITDTDIAFLLLSVVLTMLEYNLSTFMEILSVSLVLWIFPDLNKFDLPSCLVIGVLSGTYFFAIHKIPHIFPHSFTEGELAILLQTFSLHLGQVMETVIKVIIGVKYFGEPFVSITCSSKISILAIIGVCSASLLITVLNTRRKPMMFYVAYLTSAITVVFPLYLTIFQDHYMEILTYFFHNNTRIFLLLYWSTLVTLAIVIVIVQNVYLEHRSFLSLRKLFHVAIVAVYIPGIVLDRDFLYTCSVLALGILVITEAIRYLDVPPFGSALRQSFSHFLDQQDSGSLILTPIYLLIGISFPVWLLHCVDLQKNQSILLYAGILAVGVGDTMAAIGGRSVGRIKLPGSNKTFEGCLISAMSQSIFTMLLQCTDILGHVPLTIFLYLGLGALLEGFTKQIDNLVLPVFTLLLLLL